MRLQILYRHKKGIVLLEILIFLSLISAIFYLSTSFLSIYNRFVVKAELEHLYSLCMYLKGKAYLDREIKVIRFDCTNQTLYFEEKEYKLPPGVLLESVTFKDHMIFFYKDGKISSGAVYLKDKRNTCFYALTSAVSQVSYIRKYRYTNNKWNLL